MSGKHSRWLISKTSRVFKKFKLPTAVLNTEQKYSQSDELPLQLFNFENLAVAHQHQESFGDLLQFLYILIHIPLSLTFIQASGEKITDFLIAIYTFLTLEWKRMRAVESADYARNGMVSQQG